MLNIAVIGAGRIGHVHAKTIASHPDAKLALIADPFGDAAEKLAAEYGARHTTDVDSVFTDEGVDAVVIGSPTPLHIPHLLAAAKAGKAVLCEKPIALDMKDVEAAQAELDAVEVPVMFGFNRRFDISRDPSAPPAEYVKVSGGIFRDMTIHDFDMARFFLGDITEVYAVGQNFNPAIKEAGDSDAAVVTLKNADGVVATIINNRHCASGYDQRLEAQGATGTLNADNIRATTVRLNNDELTDAAEPYLDFFLQRYADAYRIELTSFIDAVNGGIKPLPGIKDAIEALRLAEAATESVATGKVVHL